MKKILLLVLGLSVLAGPSFGQSVKAASAAAKALAEKLNVSGRMAVKPVSSKALKANLKMTTQSVAMLQQLNQQKVANVMVDETLDHRQKTAVLNQINEEDAALLRDLTATRTSQRFAWAEALLRERNPRFLPKKDKNIPGLLAASPDPAKYPDMTPRFFYEWVRMIPTYEEMSEQFDGLLLALRQRLIRLNQQMFVLNKARLENQNLLRTATEPAAAGPLKARGRALDTQMEALSKDAAQSVTDLVHLLNLYPASYNESLTFLALKLDNGFQTPFTQYLRPKILVENMNQEKKIPVIRGFRWYDPPEVTV